MTEDEAIEIKEKAEMGTVTSDEVEQLADAFLGGWAIVPKRHKDRNLAKSIDNMICEIDGLKREIEDKVGEQIKEWLKIWRKGRTP